MGKSLQEKLQVTVPPKADRTVGWADASTAIDKRKFVNDDWRERTPEDVDVRTFNEMPPGMEIDQDLVEKSGGFPFVMSGSSDVSKDTNATSFAKGYKRAEMKGTDDQYTDEHTDLFYGDAGGFVERNNYLDRL